MRKSGERIAVQKCKRLRRDGGDLVDLGLWLWAFWLVLDWRALPSVARFGGIGVMAWSDSVKRWHCALEWALGFLAR